MKERGARGPGREGQGEVTGETWEGIGEAASAAD